MQITVDEYARRFKMSKEMVHAKLRAGRLQHSVVDGTTYITVEPPRQEAAAKAAADAPQQRTTAGAIIMMYQKENAQLKRKISELEAKIDRLISDKEAMLREERDRIETIYASRDEQLKSFLELVNAKIAQEGFKLGASHTAATEPAGPLPDTPAEPGRTGAAERVELFSYLESRHYTASEKKSVKKRFARAYGNDIRVIQQNGEFILDFSKYDYSDLLAH
ncbi:MAG: hypothetical protein P8Y51_07420 [Campylobacterales bacterium]|jgi:hypothetical protein